MAWQTVMRSCGRNCQQAFGFLASLLGWSRQFAARGLSGGVPGLVNRLPLI